MVDARAYDRMLWLGVASMLASIPCFVGMFTVPAFTIALLVAFLALLGAGSFAFWAWLLLRP